MNVLSLFDGMSCGQLALNRAGIKYDRYFASEVDSHAMAIAFRNFPNMEQRGDVTNITADDLPKIDLLIGGSPCQGFSMAGRKLNFDDPRSMLFFEYVRILKECKPKYFLLENVVMKKEWEDVITKELGVEPILINSNLLSAQNRKRLYWTNIPNVTQPDDKGILLRDIIQDVEHKKVDSNRIKQSWDTKNYFQYDLSGKGHKSQDQRAYFIDGKHGTLPSNGLGSKVKALTDNGDIIQLNVIECERLQTVPDNYTEGVSNTKRLNMIGNGWTVDVIAHIFKGIK
jgi:DNA-cytosine methyltransferase